MKEKSEFESQSWYGNDLWKGHIMLTVIGIPVFGFGIIYGIGRGVARVVEEVKWSNNPKMLKEILRKCVVRESSDILDEVIAHREVLTLIKHCADTTKTPFSKYFFDKCNKDRYLNIQPEKRELFDEAYDLYQKLTNTGIASRENYLKYGDPQKLGEIEKTDLAELVIDAIERVQEGLKEVKKELKEVEEIKEDSKVPQSCCESIEARKDQNNQLDDSNQPNTSKFFGILAQSSSQIANRASF